MTQPAVKKVAILFYAVVNVFWALTAYLLYRIGVPFRAIAFVACIGVVLGNLATYTGISLAARVLKRPRHFE